MFFTFMTSFILLVVQINVLISFTRQMLTILTCVCNLEQTGRTMVDNGYTYCKDPAVLALAKKFTAEALAKVMRFRYLSS